MPHNSQYEETNRSIHSIWYIYDTNTFIKLYENSNDAINREFLKIKSANNVSYYQIACRKTH